MEEKIAEETSLSLIKAELTPDKFLRVTNKANNHIYIVDAFDSPNIMREIGRLREISFRAAGGGTGKELDIDEFDTMETPCKQLIVWDPDAEMILGGYRYITGDNIAFDEEGRPRIATSHMFNFSEEFLKDYLPNTLELGGSFVRPEYQSSKAGAKALFALDNLWDGLGALTVLYPEMKYFFGKVTMYPSYCSQCRNMILYFLNKHFPDADELVRPISALQTNTDVEMMKQLFVEDGFKEDYKILNKAIRDAGYNIPPLVNAYMNLSPTMKVFGTAINDEFGDVEETGIFIKVDEILDEKKDRHIGTFKLEEATIFAVV